MNPASKQRKPETSVFATYFPTPKAAPSDLPPRVAYGVRVAFTVCLVLTTLFVAAYTTLVSLCAINNGPPATYCSNIPFIWLFMVACIMLTTVFFFVLYYAQPTRRRD